MMIGRPIILAGGIDPGGPLLFIGGGGPLLFIGGGGPLLFIGGGIIGSYT
jgi:hypothetical protein